MSGLIDTEFDSDDFLVSNIASTTPVTYSFNPNTSGHYYYSNGTGGTIATAPSFTTSGNGTGLHVQSDATFEGNIKWKGRDLGKLLEKIEDRLAILPEPDPEKLEKFAALKKAYDNYKLLEKLIGND